MNAPTHPPLSWRPGLLAACIALTLTACAPVPPPNAAWPGSPGAGPPLPLRLVGTEPFWGGTITGAEIVIEGVDRSRFRAPVVIATAIHGGGLWGFSGVDGAGRAADVGIGPGPCSDGMSDRVYPYAATVHLGAETLRGCAIPEAQWSTGR